MPNFTNQTPASTYPDILTIGTLSQVGLTNVLSQIQDAYGNGSPLSLSTIAFNIARSGYTWSLDSVAVTAQAVDINSMCQPNPVALGNQSLTIPVGTTGDRPPGPTSGMERFNTTTGFFEGYNGSTWVDFAVSGTVVNSVQGTTNQIDINGSPTIPATGAVVVSIDALYPGQSSITTLGTIATGVWHATVISPQFGGTGINNGSNTITLGGALDLIGPYNAIFNFTGGTNVTFPTSGTLATTTTANVASVTGTALQIDVSPTTGNVLVSIDAGYVGQTSITTLGTITTGVWNGTTIGVAHGGTGSTSFTAYAVLCAGTTSTGAVQNVSGLGASMQVLTSNGPGAYPSWQDIPEPTWVDISTTPQTLVFNQANIANTAGLLTFNMPATVSEGTVFEVQGKGAGGWLIQLNAGQTCIDDTQSSNSGGTVASFSSRYCSVKIICIVANTTFAVNTSNGTLAFA